MSGTKRKAEAEPESKIEKKAKIGIEVRLAGNIQLWDVIDYLQTAIKRTAFKEGFWLNLALIIDLHHFGHLYTAYRGDKLVGYMCFRAHLNEIAVLETLPEHRRQGVGQAMVDYCVKHAKSDDDHYLMLEGGPLKGSEVFWKRMGFALDRASGEHRRGIKAKPKAPGPIVIS